MYEETNIQVSDIEQLILLPKEGHEAPWRPCATHFKITTLVLTI